MSFWTVVPTLFGAPPNNATLQFFGNLTGQNSAFNTIGRKRICASIFAGGHCYLTDYPVTNGHSAASVDVYWLPWLQNSITTVTWQELDNSGCQFFLTSEFSGCRFVISDTGLSHVAYFQHDHNGISSGTSTARDYSEWNYLHRQQPPILRRKMSFTNENHSSMGARLAFNSSYANTGAPDRAIVVGYKVLRSWHFKVLKYQAGDSGHGVWSTL